MVVIFMQGPKGPPGEAGPDGEQGHEVLVNNYSLLLISELLCACGFHTLLPYVLMTNETLFIPLFLCLTF